MSSSGLRVAFDAIEGFVLQYVDTKDMYAVG
jgi:hypothetical protein